MRYRLSMFRMFSGFANLVFGVIIALLSLRFLFKLFAANSGAPFVRWLYDTTDILNSPFRGIFSTPVIEGRFVFDITTLISIVVYSLILSLIIYIFSLVFGVDEE